jgi:hypothetical protein
MLFIYPMWDNESQRIGKQMCTPLGYKLHETAELLGFIGLLLLLSTVAYLAYQGFVGAVNDNCATTATEARQSTQNYPHESPIQRQGAQQLRNSSTIRCWHRTGF